MATRESPISRSDLLRSSLEQERTKMTAGGIKQQKDKEEQKLAKCIEIVKGMKNMSMQIKNGLKELEEALDAMTFHRNSWRKAECEVKFPLPEDERLVRNVSQTLIDTIPAGQDKETEIVNESLEIPWGEVHRNRCKQYRKDEAKRRAAERESGQQIFTTTGVAAPLNYSNKEKLNPKTCSLAEVLSEIRQRVKPEETEVNINAVRKTKKGGILIELGRSSSNCKGFTNQLQEALREKALVSTLQPKLKLEFRDLDCLTTVEEVTEAIRKALPNCETDPKVILTKANSRQLRMALVEINEHYALELLKTARIKVGWVNSKIRKRLEVTRCYRCFGYGHRQATCSEPDRRKEGLCMGCGEKGHLKKNCTNKLDAFCAVLKMHATMLLGQANAEFSDRVLRGNRTADEIRVIQINTNRSRLADELLYQLAFETNTDIVLISEQYRNRDQPTWFSNPRTTSAIWISSSRNIRVEGHGSEEGFVWVTCEAMTFFSCYLTPNESIQQFRTKIDALEDAIFNTQGEVIVGGDFNAKVIEWGMPHPDSRGRKRSPGHYLHRVWSALGSLPVFTDF
ncbi:hypothetical protein Trydic_g8191 [Trypoxylus dichotomus]